MKTVILIVATSLCYSKCELDKKTKINVDLTELGRNITETIKNPTGAADDLIGHIYKYYEALAIIHSDMKKGVKEAMTAFEELRKQGGPPFLALLPVDEKDLEEFYKWQRYHGIEFRGFLKYNEDEWADMIEFADKKESAIIRRHSESLYITNMHWKNLFTLADNIFKEINNPTGDGLNLIEDVYKYFAELVALKKAVESNEPGALEFLYYLREKGGPKHLKFHPIDYTPLVEFFKWDKYAKSLFEGFLEYTWGIWRDLQAYMEMTDKKEDWIS